MMATAHISLDLASLASLVVLFLAGWAALSVILRRSLKRTVDDLRREMDERMNLLLALVKAEHASAEQTRQASKSVSLSPTPSLPVPQPAMPEARNREDVTPEILVMIAAAVTAFLGKKVRIRSAHMLQTPYEIVNPWVQQGRVFVQASHNLTQRGH